MSGDPGPGADRRPRRVLLANAARARIFERDPGNGALRELADFVHPASRLPSRSLEHDRQGSLGKGASRTAFERATAVADRERERFAQQLAQHLETTARGGDLPAWALLASSPFLGHLQAALGPAATARLVARAERDLTGLPIRELERRLRSLLPAGALPPD